MATSRRVGNYSTSAKAVIRNSDAIFDAAMSGKPDFTKISKEAIKGRSLERRAVTKAEAEVANAGLKAYRDTNLTKIKEDTKKEVSDILRPAKRMAGVVAGLGALTTGYVTMQENKKTKAESDQLRSERDAIYARQEERWAESDKRYEEMMKAWRNSSGGSSNDSSPAPSTSETKPTNAGSTGESQIKPSGVTPATTKPTAVKPSGKSGLYSQSDIQSLAVQAGFSPANAATVAAIGMGESGGKAGIDTVQSGLDPGKKNEFSVGLLQINTKAHMDKLTRRGWNIESLRDPVKNLTIAKEVFDEAGGSFKPWGAFTNGSYKKYL